MDITTVVGNLAFVCTIFANFAGLEVCLKFISLKTTGSISPLPFVSGLLCTCLWLKYGILVHDSVQIGVNVVAMVLQFIYILCFYIYTPDKKTLFFEVFFVLCFLALLSSYTSYHENKRDMVTNIVGFLACAGSVIACASPMASVKEVLRSKSTDVLPFFIILASFIVSSLWLAYGILIRDIFLQVPNVICAVLGGIQLSLYAIFPNKKYKEL